LLHLTIFLILTLFVTAIFLDFFKKEQTRFAKDVKQKNYKNLFDLKKMSSFFEKLMLSFVFLNKKSRLFQFCWTFGFLSWILGCYFWVINSEPVSSIFVIVSIIFCLLGLFKIRDFRKNKPDISSKENFDFGIYIVLIVISVLTMVLSKSIANGITGIISLFIVWQAYKINKAMRDQ